MKTPTIIAITCAAGLLAPASGHAADHHQQRQIANPQVDPIAHRETVARALLLREKRRVTEAQFMELAQQPGTVVLDARSESKFKLRHIKGAVNLPFTDFTAVNLARLIPAKETRVLIYCNNNFAGDRVAFAEKRAAAALNLSTFTNLVIYGYSNVFELGPLVDVASTRLPFEGTDVDAHPGAP